MKRDTCNGCFNKYFTLIQCDNCHKKYCKKCIYHTGNSIVCIECVDMRYINEKYADINDTNVYPNIL